MMDNLNNGFRNNGINLRFYLAEVTNFIDPNAIVVETGLERSQIALRFRDVDALNIHIVDQLEIIGSGIYLPLHNAILIERGVGLNENSATTFTHEVGHFFGLYHTHMFKNHDCLEEPVDRWKFTTCPNGPGYFPRCLVTGDLLCDTPADPNMNDYGTYNFNNCSWTGNLVRDRYGDQYSPDTRNFMAYGNQDITPGTNQPVCRSNFTTGQRNWMYFWAFNRQFRPSWVPTDDNDFDRFEPDDAGVAAREISLNSPQTHTFHVQGRRDDVDWLRFSYKNGSLGNYILEINEIDGSAVGNVNIFLRDPSNGNPVTRVNGITSTISGSSQTFTIPCSALTVGDDYLIEIRRGSGGTDRYEVELRHDYSGAVPVISGSSSICGGRTIYYSVSDLGAGFSYNWSVSSGLQIVSGAGTNRIGVRSTTSSGTGEVKVTVVRSIGCSYKAQSKNVSIHSSNPPWTNGAIQGETNPICTYSTALYFVPLYQNTTFNNYTWELYPNAPHSIISGQGTNDIVLEVYQEGYYTLCVTVPGPCGPVYNSIFIEVDGCGSTYSAGSYTYYPNPPDGELTVSLKEDDNEINNKSVVASTTKEFEVKLINNKGEEIRSEKSKNQKPIKIKTDNLPNGLYYLHILDDKEVVKKQIMIQH